MNESAFEHDHTAIGVSWLPHFHDMGLLGGILQPFFIGGLAVLMDPMAFVQKPIRWLRAIDRFRAAIAGGPSFAYDLCVRQCAPADVAALDLSSWTLAFCGAEPIRPAALAGFAEKCAPAGFSSRAFTPCYGLAEATLIVSCVKPGLGLRQLPALRLGETAGGATVPAVSCGPPVTGCEIRIVNDAGAPAQAGESGEICVSGPHVSPGVWNGAERSVTPFPEAFEEAGARFLRTGDVGAILDGELAPIDRIKDIIILYGQKLHAADIEASLLAHPLAADLLAACAFATDGASGAQLILLCEMDRKAFKAGGAGELAPKLAKLVAEAYGALPQLRIFPYGSLPRTSSGKIQRLKSKADWLSGAFAAAAAPYGGSA
jgi:acyl-CoA synthetase (AMP-forming)/AMP-acid ligase II